MKPAEYQYVCLPCGAKAQKQAGIEPSINHVMTCSQGPCDACGVTASVTGVRNFGYPYTKPAYFTHWT